MSDGLAELAMAGIPCVVSSWLSEDVLGGLGRSMILQSDRLQSDSADEVSTALRVDVTM